MREAVIVIEDLYLQAGELPGATAADSEALAGLEYAGRFGERERLEAGWRQWLARWLGRDDLAGVSVAAIAAAGAAGAAGAELASVTAGGAAAARWIATPVGLVAGLTRVHLERRGLVRLTPQEQAVFADAFHRTFGDSGLRLEPLSDGQFVAVTPGIAAVATAEPARCAGGELVVPRGPSAAPLLRLLAEIEMWLHGAALNQARTARGAAPVTGLWLWGAAGRELPAAPARTEHPANVGRAANGARRGATRAFGSNAFVAGLLHLEGGVLEPPPECADAVFADSATERALLLADVAGELSGEDPGALSAAAARLDRRLIRPGLRALREGLLGRLTLVANDTRLALGRRSGMKRWRRPRAGLAALV